MARATPRRPSLYSRQRLSASKQAPSFSIRHEITKSSSTRASASPRHAKNNRRQKKRQPAISTPSSLAVIGFCQFASSGFRHPIQLWLLRSRPSSCACLQQVSCAHRRKLPSRLSLPPVLHHASRARRSDLNASLPPFRSPRPSPAPSRISRSRRRPQLRPAPSCLLWTGTTSSRCESSADDTSFFSLSPMECSPEAQEPCSSRRVWRNPSSPRFPSTRS